MKHLLVSAVMVLALVLVGCPVEPVLQYYLTMQVSPSGAGTVTPTSGYYDKGTVVQIKAVPAANWQFDHWVGSVSNPSVSTTTVKMNTNQTVKAVFKETVPESREISFADLTWVVKSSGSGRLDPGNNYFSDDGDNVWVDGNGLNLALRYVDGKWLCSEVLLEQSLGYGTYCFSTHGRVDLLDPNLVFGLFTWSDIAKLIKHKEFDFEFSRWGNPLDPTNAQFAINPFWLGMVERYYLELTDAAADVTLYLVWQPDYVEFRSYYGRYTLTNLPPADKLIFAWVYDQEAIPAPGNEAVHLNLWLNDNAGPQDSSETFVTISDFDQQDMVPVWPETPVEPGIEITYMPPAGSVNKLQGKVYGVDPSECWVVAYIKSYGSWWIKPYLNKPLTTIKSDSTFAVDIETDPYDVNLTEVLVVLIPKTVTPPACNPCSSQPVIAGSLAEDSAVR